MEFIFLQQISQQMQPAGGIAPKPLNTQHIISFIYYLYLFSISLKLAVYEELRVASCIRGCGGQGQGLDAPTLLKVFLTSHLIQ